MPKVTLFLPDELAKAVKAAAQRSNQSVSSYVTNLVRKDLAADKVQMAFLKTHGTWLGDSPQIDDALPEDSGLL